MTNEQRPFFISKDLLDSLNSVSWFLMDASWMLQAEEISIFMILPTVLSGLILCYIEKRRTHTLINIAILSWICMNISWMFSEVLELSSYLTIAKVFFVTGCLFVIMALITSENVSETFSHFKRFRLKNWK
jgi:FtsH-binding integral membrane protein